MEKCRKCKKLTAINCDFNGNPINLKFLYKCKNKKCGIFWWHRRILRKFDNKVPSSDRNKKIEKNIINELLVPDRNLKCRFVYVIKLDWRDNGNSVYVGESGRHPLTRYLQHLRGYKSGRKHVTDFGKYLLTFKEVKNDSTVSKIEEKKLAAQLMQKGYIVRGGH